MRKNTELSSKLILKAALLWTSILAFSQVALGQQEVLNGVISEYESSSESLVIDAAFIKDARSCSAAGPRNTPSMRFHSASISKLFTAIVIMQLRDEGLLSLEDRLELHLPEFQNSDIRLYQLLTHTSGLNGRDRSKSRTTQEQVNDYIKSVSRQRTREPGSRWRYADSNFNLLGRVIERIIGETFSSVMRNRVLIPAGMTESSFDINQVEMNLRTTSFSKRGRPEKHPWDLAFLPSSGLQTTASDLIKFASEILSISNGESSSILSKDSLSEMVLPRLDTNWGALHKDMVGSW